MNKLSATTSPYLLQHANNPVDWYPWEKEALDKAKAEDKPIFLSIGYAACHWCHVMAHESFEDEETAKFMNEHFVNIKVDREERPDIDGIYMQAVIAMTGSGGWPMSVFLTPDLKPFYAGTYFPPVRRFNMPAFKDILSGLSNAWKNDRTEVEKTGLQVSTHLQTKVKTQNTESLTIDHLNAIAKAMQSSYDWGYGGWGDAPKFPQAMALEFLLHHSVATKNNEYILLIKHCLQAMSRGGMYDVVGGGFSRYSTDNLWRVPHFEKTTYDNALLVRTYLHVWQVTREPAFKRIVEETLDFIAREMTHEQGGFYSSLDADSESEEGKFYTWSLAEIRDVLQGGAEFFEAAYGIIADGNWEGKTVLHREMDDAALAARFKLNLEAVPEKLAESHSKLLAARSIRIRPGTDDKILTSWNGLMLAACAEAARVLAGSSTNASNYLTLATNSAEFLLSELRPNGILFRAWRDGKTTNKAFLEDYAALILGLLELYQTDFNNKWYISAKELADEMIERFSDPEGGFFDTPHDGEVLLIRPKEVQDNATPSGNSLACAALMKLAAYTDEGKYRDIAEKSLMLITGFALRYPLGFANWLSAAAYAAGNTKQVAVLGEAQDENFQRMLNVLRAEYRPNMVTAASSHPVLEDSPALLHNRGTIGNTTTAYVCEGFVCKQPATDIEIFIKQLNS
ncbi:MAG: thioredoxin domain-containing protein [Anaerolineales bacterium]|nr:thioredoxin domain-containing protein [Anaerolineales bacterium]